MRSEYNGYFITPEKTSPPLVYISTVGKGGKVPDVLSGLFTSRTEAYKAIDAYLNFKDKKGNKNVETVSESAA